MFGYRFLPFWSPVGCKNGFEDRLVLIDFNKSLSPNQREVKERPSSEEDVDVVGKKKVRYSNLTF